MLDLRRTPSHMAPFGGEGPLTLISDLEAGGLVSQCPSGGEGMGSKLGWLPVDGASGDFLIQESHPLQGCVRSYAIVCSLITLPYVV